MTHEQFRIGGTIRLIGEDSGDATLAAARRETWRDLPEATRTSFTWPAPGLPAIAAFRSRSNILTPENRCLISR